MMLVETCTVMTAAGQDESSSPQDSTAIPKTLSSFFAILRTVNHFNRNQEQDVLDGFKRTRGLAKVAVSDGLFWRKSEYDLQAHEFH